MSTHKESRLWKACQKLITCVLANWSWLSNGGSSLDPECKGRFIFGILCFDWGLDTNAVQVEEVGLPTRVCDRERKNTFRTLSTLNHDFNSYWIFLTCFTLSHTFSFTVPSNTILFFSTFCTLFYTFRTLPKQNFIPLSLRNTLA